MYNYGYGYPSMMGYWGVGDVIGHIIGFLIMVAVLLFVLRLIFGRRMHGKMRHSFGGFGLSAIETLRERYAKGEIDKAEFEERKKVLME